MKIHQKHVLLLLVGALAIGTLLIGYPYLDITTHNMIAIMDAPHVYDTNEYGNGEFNLATPANHIRYNVTDSVILASEETNVTLDTLIDDILEGGNMHHDLVVDGVSINGDVCDQGPDVDNWQAVSENITYVYSAHLNPDSSKKGSIIHVVGSILSRYPKQPKYVTVAPNYYCRVWVRSSDLQAPEVYTAQVSEMSGRGYTYGL